MPLVLTTSLSQRAESQQGSKLVGTGAGEVAYQSYSVSLSADGNTAIVGGRHDNNSAGAAWVYVILPQVQIVTNY